LSFFRLSFLTAVTSFLRIQKEVVGEAACLDQVITDLKGQGIIAVERHEASILTDPAGGVLTRSS
jgi:hypothetical protein